MDGVDDRNESIGGLDWIGSIVCFRCWEIVLRVDVGCDGSSIAFVGNSTQDEAIGFDGDRFIRVSLQQTRCREESDFDVWDVIRRDLQDLKVAQLVVDCPVDFALAFDL